MRFSMIRDMMRVERARLGARSYAVGSDLAAAFRGILAIGWRTGHRLAEFVAHPSGEVCYFTRADVTFVIGGVVVADPTPAQLSQVRPGDVILLRPPRSKTDQFGEIHCPFPSSVPIVDDLTSAGQLILQIERSKPCHGSARDATPLLADEHGLPYTHGVMDTLLHNMLTHLYGARVASCYSFHSLRIGLATALKAAKVDDDIIQMICRWMNPESLRAYARHGQSLHINCVDQAEKAVIDAIQSSNVPKTCNTEGAAAINLAFGGDISARARAVLDAADDVEATADVAPTPTPDLSPLAGNALGRRVLVPQSIYPTEQCDENDGRGWTARVVNYRGGVATTRFVHAATPRGIPYEDVLLRVDVLEPM